MSGVICASTAWTVAPLDSAPSPPFSPHPRYQDHSTTWQNRCYTFTVCFLSLTNLGPFHFTVSMTTSFPSGRRIRAEHFLRSDICRSLNIRGIVEETISVELIGAQGALRFRRSCVVTVGSKCVFDFNILPYPGSRTDICVADKYRRLVVSLGAFSQHRIPKRTQLRGPAPGPEIPGPQMVPPPLYSPHSPGPKWNNCQNTTAANGCGIAQN